MSPYIYLIFFPVLFFPVQANTTDIHLKKRICVLINTLLQYQILHL